jgi:hypothetical protein
MNCDSAGRLLDDLTGDQLSRRERQRLEDHLSSCPRCAKILRERLVLEQRIRQALTASVLQLRLPPGASRATILAVERSFQKPGWRLRLRPIAQVLAGVAAAALLFLGMLLLSERVPIPPLAGQQTAHSPVIRPALSVDQDRISFEPVNMAPGDRFTVTVPIESNLLQAIDAVRCDLEISGPTGQYRFALFMQGPLPARGLSIIQVTPELLAGPSREQYQLSPDQIFGLPGAYAFRVTVFSPMVASSQ